MSRKTTRYLLISNMYNFDLILNLFGTCTNIILQVFVDLEILKSTPPRVRRVTTQIHSLCQGVGTYYGMQSNDIGVSSIHGSSLILEASYCSHLRYLA